MKNRERLLLLAVLVPTVVLLWLAFDSPREEPVAPVERVVPPVNEAPTAPVAHVSWPTVPDAGEPVEAPSGALVLEDLHVPAALAETVAAVTPEVELCVHDQQDRVQGGVRFTVEFAPGGDGGFGAYRLKASSWQDPYLEACLEDVFAEVKAPPGAVPGELTFGFRRSMH